MWYKNVAGRFFGLVTKHACDGRTDRQNYDSRDRASIAASSGKRRSTAGEVTDKKVDCLSAPCANALSF